MRSPPKNIEMRGAGPALEVDWGTQCRRLRERPRFLHDNGENEVIPEPETSKRVGMSLMGTSSLLLTSTVSKG